MESPDSVEQNDPARLPVARRPFPSTAEPHVREVLTTYLGHQLDIYKSHFEFFLKAFGFYLTLSGGFGWAVLASSLSPQWKGAAAGVSAAVALIAMYGGYFSMRWVQSIEAGVQGTCEQLRLTPIQFDGAKNTIRMAFMFLFLVFVASVVCMVVFSSLVT